VAAGEAGEAWETEGVDCNAKGVTGRPARTHHGPRARAGRRPRSLEENAGSTTDRRGARRAAVQGAFLLFSGAWRGVDGTWLDPVDSHKRLQASRAQIPRGYPHRGVTIRTP
jgi:hypothetical protein